MLHSTPQVTKSSVVNMLLSKTFNCYVIVVHS